MPSKANELMNRSHRDVSCSRCNKPCDRHPKSESSCSECLLLKKQCALFRLVVVMGGKDQRGGGKVKQCVGCADTNSKQQCDAHQGPMSSRIFPGELGLGGERTIAYYTPQDIERVAS